MNGAVRLAVLGDPLAFTRSPELHRAGLAALGIAGDSRALRTPKDQLATRLRDLAEEGVRGVNLTHPLKECVLPLLERVSDGARRARSVNTVGLDPGGWWGETTDGPGFLDLLRALSREPREERAMLLGAGGAARSLAVALADAGAEPPVLSARAPDRARDALAGEAARLVAWRSSEEHEALARATLIVNATPLSNPADLLPPVRIGRGVLLVDLTYGEALTPWVVNARHAGIEAIDGLGLLVFQARRSLAHWLHHEVPLEPLTAAVGWPR